MNNNDILIRVRYALDIKNSEMVEIFKLGGIEVTEEEVLKMLIKTKDSYDDKTDDKTDNESDEKNNESDLEKNEEKLECDNFTLESFLNGFIIFKRGKQDPRPGQPERPALSIKDSGSVNNIMLKKLKIALALSSEDMLEILEAAGVSLSKGELGAVFRKEGHRNYKECGDRYARNFLKGLAIKYRG